MPCQRLTLLGLVTLFSACGSDTGPSTVPLGRYGYVADVRTRDSPGPTHFAGTLTLTSATEEEIVGTWAVEGYRTQAASGGRIVDADAYVLYAYVPGDDGVIIAHEIGLGVTSLPCEIRYVWGDISNDGTCTITKQ
jgi:hypothetical protein